MSANHLGTSSRRGQREVVKRVLGKIDRGSREIWRVACDGRIKNLRTTSSSTKAMDQAMVIYGHALKRFADRKWDFAISNGTRKLPRVTVTRGACPADHSVAVTAAWTVAWLETVNLRISIFPASIAGCSTIRYVTAAQPNAAVTPRSDAGQRFQP